jgi:putative endonuclease
MIVCYILYSKQLDIFYTGITQENIESRLSKHNQASYGFHFTSRANDWEVFLLIECDSVSQSMKIEKHIKKMKSKKFIYNLKLFPQIIEKLKQQY